MVQITRRIEFDAGHRIPDHKSKCRNIHGHRYALECTVEGPLIEEGSADGMVVDFGDLKSVMEACVGLPWDHAFLVADDDKAMLRVLAELGPTHKTIVIAGPPTVENLANRAFAEIRGALEALGPHAFRLTALRLYETPNCWADVHAESWRVVA